MRPPIAALAGTTFAAILFTRDLKHCAIDPRSFRFLFRIDFFSAPSDLKVRSP